MDALIKKEFFRIVADMLRSIDRREEYIPCDTPVKDVNYASIFDQFPKEITVADLENELEEYLEEQSKV